MLTPGSSVTAASSVRALSSFVVPRTLRKVRFNHGCLITTCPTSSSPGSISLIAKRAFCNAPLHPRNLGIHSTPPRLQPHEVLHGKAETMGFEERPHRDDEQQQSQPEKGEPALRRLFAKFVNRSGG